MIKKFDENRTQSYATKIGTICNANITGMGLIVQNGGKPRELRKKVNQYKYGGHRQHARSDVFNSHLIYEPSVYEQLS